jgi:hypothetical protein
MFLIAVALFAAVPADRWVHVGGETGKYQEYLDNESVGRSGDRVTLWIRRDFELGRATAWNELELDCSRKLATVLAYVRDDGGTISHNVVRPHREASPIDPDSVEETIFNLACR